MRGLLGLLLVDGSLVPYRCPGGGYIQMVLTAGVSESAFLEEKVAEFREFLPSKAQIIPYRTAARANGKSTPVLRYRVSTNRLRPVYNLLYPGGERTITATALGLLGARAAAWLWAEGARPRKDGGCELARVGQGVGEASLLQQWLAMLTGAESQVDDRRRRPRLIFDAEQRRKISAALHPYAPSSRLHLFVMEGSDAGGSSESGECFGVCGPGVELLHGAGAAQPAWASAAALADDAVLRAPAIRA